MLGNGNGQPCLGINDQSFFGPFKIYIGPTSVCVTACHLCPALFLFVEIWILELVNWYFHLIIEFFISVMFFNC